MTAAQRVSDKVLENEIANYKANGVEGGVGPFENALSLDLRDCRAQLATAQLRIKSLETAMGIGKGAGMLAGFTEADKKSFGKQPQ